MHCCAYYHLPDHTGDPSFTIEVNPFTFGSGSLRQVGFTAKNLGLKRVLLLTDPRVARTQHVATVCESLAKFGIKPVIYGECVAEPTDHSLQAAAAFAKEGNYDGYIAVGGGSVIDTAKAANLYATYPDDFLAYVNAPIGQGKPVPGPLKPLLACPTTIGTGSEVTGVSIFYLTPLAGKTGIISRHLLPTHAFIDPDVADTLPLGVLAANGFDAMAHALESYTARPHTTRPFNYGEQRPMNQGANAWSDMGAREALRLIGQNLLRAVSDPSDKDARRNVCFAATVAGMTFSNAGCHLPHGMSYAVSGLLARTPGQFFAPAGYPQNAPMVPHGMSVALNSPAVYRHIGCACPERHLEAAQLLGADTRDVPLSAAGDFLADQIIHFMKTVGLPNGLNAVGYSATDAAALAAVTFPQKRVVGNAPMPISEADLTAMFTNAMKYW